MQLFRFKILQKYAGLSFLHIWIFLSLSDNLSCGRTDTSGLLNKTLSGTITPPIPDALVTVILSKDSGWQPIVQLWIMVQFLATCCPIIRSVTCVLFRQSAVIQTFVLIISHMTITSLIHSLLWCYDIIHTTN